MYLMLKTPPAVAPVTLAEVKEHLRISNTASDTYLNALITLSRTFADGPGGILRRALTTQTWYLKGRDFPADTIRLPIPPLQSVVAITYFDVDGVEQTFPAEKYRVVKPEGAAGLVELIDTAAWPSLDDRPDAFAIEFVAGYGDAASDIPEPIKHGLLLYIGSLFTNRGDHESADASGNVAADRLLSPYRWREFA